MGALFDEVVRNLDRLDTMDQKLQEMGAKHGLYQSMQPRFFDIFAEAFIDCTLEWGEKSRRVEDVRRAWAIIAGFVVDRMKIGLTDGRKQMFKSRKSVVKQ